MESRLRPLPRNLLNRGKSKQNTEAGFHKLSSSISKPIIAPWADWGSVLSWNLAADGGGVEKPKPITSKKSAAPSPRTLETTAIPLTGRPDPVKLRHIVKEFGEFPAKYRSFIWRALLEVPQSSAAFEGLVAKGVHQRAALLHSKFPITDEKLSRGLLRILSALSFWSPVLGECEFLPPLVFPFVKLFQNNHLLCFEICATVISNWCYHWFEYFPNPPLNMLSFVENLVAQHDFLLYRHLVRNRITALYYAWPLLESLLSSQLPRAEWLALFDNLISQPPGFLLCVAAAYVVVSHATLIQLTDPYDVQYYMTHASAVSVRAVLRKAYRMAASTPPAMNPVCQLEPFRALVPLVNVSRETLAPSAGALGSSQPLGYSAPEATARERGTCKNLNSSRAKSTSTCAVPGDVQVDEAAAAAHRSSCVSLGSGSNCANVQYPPFTRYPARLLSTHPSEDPLAALAHSRTTHICARAAQ